MARITVEDCLKRIDNQFDLILVAAKRARRLANGADPLVPVENDKPTVIALREIAAGLITEEILDQMAQPEDDILSSEQAEELLASTPIPGLDAPAEAALIATPIPPAATAAEKIVPVEAAAEKAAPAPEAVKPAAPAAEDDDSADA